MSEPFYRSKRTIDRIGLVVAILSVLVFVFSCLFNVYSYSITPTITPTFTFTPTATRTLRPTTTPTITPTITVTATELLPSQTVSPTVDPLIEPISMVLEALHESEYECSYSEQDDSILMAACVKEIEENQIRFTFEYEILDQASFHYGQLIIDPAAAIMTEPTITEIIWLSQIPFISLDDPTPTSTAATPTIEATETIDLATWLAENLQQLADDIPLQFEQEEFVYTILTDGEIFTLTIEKIE